MTTIYENAIFVLMWMGPEDGSSNIAMKFLVNYDNGRVEASSRLDLLPQSIDVYASLIGILEWKYWSRVWIT